MTAKSFFGRRGLLSRSHPHYEYRPGQLEMAEAVESALKERRHLIVEAGTGTGKTLAYLVPSILAGERVVISTGTKNLQEQLYFKDLPFLQSFFDRPLAVCYMKGRANYLCRQKLYDAERDPMLTGFEEIRDFQLIRDWERTTETGDRSEVRELPEVSSTWWKLDARSDLCAGQKCKQFDRCFITEMHRRAVQSDIIIVNHHLFFADLAVRDQAYGGILPEYSAVIFDEAHEIEEVAGQYFGMSVSNLQLQELVKDTAAISRRKLFATPRTRSQLDSHWGTHRRLLQAVSAGGPAGFSRSRGFPGHHEDVTANCCSLWMHSAPGWSWCKVLSKRRCHWSGGPSSFNRRFTSGWTALKRLMSIGPSGAGAVYICRPRPSMSRKHWPRIYSIASTPWC